MGFPLITNGGEFPRKRGHSLLHSVIVGINRSDKEAQRQVDVDRVIALGSLDSLMVSMLTPGIARNVGLKNLLLAQCSLFL